MDKKRTACIAGAFLAGAVIGGGATCGVFLHKDSVRVQKETALRNSINDNFNAKIEDGKLVSEDYSCGKNGNSATVTFKAAASDKGNIKLISGLEVVYQGQFDSDGFSGAMTVAEKFCTDGSFEKPKAPKL